MRQAWLRALLGGAVLLVGSTAGADDGLRRYEATDQCPSREAFAARVRAHLVGISVEHEPSLGVDLLPDPTGGFLGRLEVIDPAGDRTSREIAGKSCDEVARALAFVAALSISPDATPVESAPASPPSVAPSAGAGLETAETKPAANEQPAETPAAPPAARGAFSVEAAPELVIGPLPRAAAGGRLRLGWRALAVVAKYASAGSVDLSPGAVTFSLATIRPELCPFELGTRARLAACGGVDVGAMFASSEGVAGARSVPTLWLAASVVGRGAINFSEAFYVVAELSGAVLLHQPRYQLDPPQTSVHTPSTVSAATSIGLGVSF